MLTQGCCQSYSISETFLQGFSACKRAATLPVKLARCPDNSLKIAVLVSNRGVVSLLILPLHLLSVVSNFVCTATGFQRVGAKPMLPPSQVNWLLSWDMRAVD